MRFARRPAKTLDSSEWQIKKCRHPEPSLFWGCEDLIL